MHVFDAATLRRVLLASLLLFAACDAGGDDAPSTLTGSWTGQVMSEGVPLTIEMELTEAMFFLTGTGTIALPQETLAFTLTGEHLHPNIGMQLDFGGGERPGTLQGTVTDDLARIEGSASGPGFGGPVTLTRP